MARRRFLKKTVVRDNGWGGEHDEAIDLLSMLDAEVESHCHYPVAKNTRDLVDREYQG